MVLDAHIVGLWIARAMEPEEDKGEIRKPADEQSYHQPVDVDDQIIDVFSMLGSQNRQTENLLHVHISVVSRSEESECAAVAVLAEERRDRYTKNVAIAPSTVMITARRLRIPQFIPLAIAESDCP